MRKAIAITLVFSLLFVPVMADTETVDPDYKAGKLHGEQNAKGESGWMLAGLLLGPLGVALAYLMKPGVYTGDLTGKSANYIKGYKDGYRFKTVQLNVDSAFTGTFGFLFIMFWFSLGQNK